MRPSRERRGALPEGLIAGAVALAASFAVSAAVTGLTFPPLALADRIIRLAPGGLETFAIERLGHVALPLVGVFSVALFLVLGAGIGVLLPQSGKNTAAAAGAGFSAALVAAGIAAPGAASPGAATAPAAAGGAAFAAALWRLRGGRLQRTTFDPGRRRALVELGAGAATLFLLGTGVGRLLAPVTRPRVGGLAAPTSPRRRRLPRIGGLSAEVTSVDSHYVVDIDLNDPVVDTGDWALTVDGLVERPLRLDFEELQRRFSLVGDYSVLTCISNRVGGPLAGNSLWQGVRLRELLRTAGPRADARDVVFRCADGYTAAIPLEQALDPSVLLAIAQNGQALTREHGFPCRLRAPALYGIKNPKWIEEITVTDRPYEGYWQRQGWTDRAVVRTASRIDTPKAATAGQPTWVAGVAWAGLRGIAKVEVSTDGGRTWNDAQLERPLSPYAWTAWAYRWTAPGPGRHEIVCRATDGEGQLQDRTRRSPHPSGASGYHQRTVEVR